MRSYEAPTVDASVRLDRFAVGVLAAFLVVATVDELLFDVTVLRAVLAVVLVAVVPGALLVSLLGVRPSPTARWLLYVVTASLVLFMGLGLVLNLALPRVGYAEPLGPGPVTLGLALLVGELAYLRLAGDLVTEDAVELRIEFDPSDPAVPAALLMPPLAVVGVTLLNVTGENALLVALLVAIAVIPAVLARGRSGGGTATLVVWCLGLALLYHASLWRGYVFGGHAYVVAVWERLHFSPTEIELLANAVVWPATARLAGVDIITQMKVINPLFVALVPVALFVTFRSYTDARLAVLGASLFAFAHPFYFLYPTAGRTATPVFFIAVLGAVVADRSLSAFQRRALSVLAALGIIVSHYGTSYYVMYAIVAALGLLGALRLVDRVVERAVEAAAPDDDPWVPAGWTPPATVESPRVLTLPFAAFYLAGVVGWYMHTGGGQRFEGLVEHMRRTYSSLMTPGTRGSTATRLTTDYGTVSITLSKVVYVVVGCLILVGLAGVYYRRVRPSGETRFDDEYLVLGTAILVLFGGTFVVSGQWGGGRPMMIVFSTTAIFAVLGARTLARLGGAIADRPRPARLGAAAGSLAERSRARPVASFLRATRPGWRGAFAALLVVMLSLNTGVAAAVLLGGFAPSNVPLQEELSSSPSPNHQSRLYVAEDVRTHAWLADHRDPGLEIYGDRLARAQTTDRYNAEIARLSERPPYRFRKRNHIDHVHPDFAAGYVVLIGHNVEHGTLAISFVEWGLLAEYDLETDRTATVYVNDHGRIYYHPTTATGNRTAAA